MTHDNKRIYWIDNLKALGIILIVYGHVQISGVLTRYIYSFHVPLFFFISGYLFNSKKYTDFRLFLKTKIKSLLVPYFVFSLISYVIWFINIMLKSHFINDNSRIDIYKPIIGIFYSNGINGWLEHNVALWFLTCLFITELLFYLFIRVINKDNQLLIILIISAFIGYVDSILMPIRLPWSIDIAFTSVVFYGIGYLIRKKEVLENAKINQNIALSISIFSSIIFSLLNGSVNMNNNFYNNILFYYISAFSGIFALLIISKKIKNIKLIRYLGQKSLNVMVIHILVFYFLSYIKFALFKVVLHKSVPKNNALSSIIFTITAILIILLGTYFYEKLVNYNEYLELIKDGGISQKQNDNTI